MIRQCLNCQHWAVCTIATEVSALSTPLRLCVEGHLIAVAQDELVDRVMGFAMLELAKYCPFFVEKPAEDGSLL